ncbi:MAG TPA: isoprenylcysteine carboxylmethyltransferase family protein [Candidatus Dormibacteraeota bacterium]|nr:isoprenylcysteine carboxylmethyltransferase family protein [Candidatus Dormibacteraeota bacterium]
MNATLVGPFLRSLVFLIVAPGSVIVLIPWLLLRGSTLAPIAPAVGYLLIAGGAVVLLWSFFGFAFIGRGSPAPIDAPRRLVVWGPYRWVRNPIYLALLTILVGESLAFSPALLAYAVIVAAACVLFVRLYEEPTLRTRFGAEYEAYRARVPAWFPRPPS